MAFVVRRGGRDISVGATLTRMLVRPTAGQPDRAEMLGLTLGQAEHGGVRITAVREGSTAARQGIRVGDVVHRVQHHG